MYVQASATVRKPCLKVGLIVQKVYHEDEEKEGEASKAKIESCGTVRIPGDRNRYDLQCEIWVGMHSVSQFY
jgi:hypothetical protein